MNYLEKSQLCYGQCIFPKLNRRDAIVRSYPLMIDYFSCVVRVDELLVYVNTVKPVHRTGLKLSWIISFKPTCTENSMRR